MAKGIVHIGPYNTNIDTSLKAIYLTYRAKGEVKNKQVQFYINSKELGRELSRPRTLKTLCKNIIKLRGLNPKAHKFFLLDRCPKYTSMEREELCTEKETVILKGGLNVWLKRLCKKRKKKRLGVG